MAACNTYTPVTGITARLSVLRQNEVNSHVINGHVKDLSMPATDTTAGCHEAKGDKLMLSMDIFKNLFMPATDTTAVCTEAKGGKLTHYQWTYLRLIYASY